MQLWKNFWCDEAGSVVSAELVLVGALGVAGATAGFQQVSKSLNAEFEDLATAFRRLDQSYSFRGYSSCGGWSAGSCYTQPSADGKTREVQPDIGLTPEILEAIEAEKAAPAPEGPAVPAPAGKAEEPVAPTPPKETKSENPSALLAPEAVETPHPAS